MTFGVESLLFIFLNYAAPEIFNLKLLYSLAFITGILILCGTYILKTGVSKTELWIRRSVLILIAGFVCPISQILFDCINLSGFAEYVRFFAVIIFSMVLFFSAAYFIVDIVEKNTLKKINEKLEDFSKNK